ncbi:MAG: hypothetical protein LC796_00365 [Acidobacteria bacterium]|nr:hypothetical protein [Acidobacteriota bacterium]MCA1609453.1 hypothetical protein [Acidobacteriota bacterium]
MHEARSTMHLTDAQLFGLAIPAAGVPEALPPHLSECIACSRALQTWKGAVGEIAGEMGPIGARTPEAWADAEDLTMRSIRRAGSIRRGTPLRWGVGIAASLLLLALAVPMRRSGSGAPAAATPSDLSPQDQADDALLRDVARLARAEETGGSWDALVPQPGTQTRDEERL